MSESMLDLFESLSTPMWAAIFVMLGGCVGTALVKVIERLADGQPCRPRLRCGQCQEPFPWQSRLPWVGWIAIGRKCRACQASIPSWYEWFPVVCGLLFGVYVVLVLDLRCQQIEQVHPDTLWKYGRIVYHLTLVTLLIAATGTDVRRFVVPDAVTVTGMLIGVGGAVVSGDLQMVHLWIDWNSEAIFVGAYIPEWVVAHRHWHGLAWSLAGLLAGGGLTWGLRLISGRILGGEALGFGDVTLMAMIGSFVGWQAVLFIFLVAPLLAFFAGLVVGLTGRRTYLPYGPYLSGATYIVLCTWRWLWRPTRDIFGHWPSLLGLAAVAMGALGGLLILARMYRSIPVEHTKLERALQRERSQSDQPSSSTEAVRDEDITAE